MSKKFAVLKGTSGTGKGTRVVQLIEFLKTKYKSKPVMVAHKGKKRQIALSFPSLGIAFIGRVVTSNKSGLASWTSMDDLHAGFGKGEIARQQIKDNVLSKFDVVVAEGEPMMQSDKWRPLFMKEFYGVDDFFFQYFHYAGDREAYDKRIIGRSGKAAGESGWHREEAYEREFNTVMSELTSLGYRQSVCPVSGETGKWDSDTGETHNVLNKYDQAVHEWGFMFLSWVGLGELQAEFVAYAEKNPTLREIGGANPLAKTKRLW